MGYYTTFSNRKIPQKKPGSYTTENREKSAFELLITTITCRVACTSMSELTLVQQYNTVNLRISARDAYFKIRIRRGERLFEGGTYLGWGPCLIFPKS